MTTALYTFILPGNDKGVEEFELVMTAAQLKELKKQLKLLED